MLLSLTVWLNSCIHLFALGYVYINRDPSSGTCWDYVQDRAFELYEKIDFEHRVTLAGMFSNNLIDLSTAKRISKMMLNWTNDKSYWFHADKSSAMEL